MSQREREVSYPLTYKLILWPGSDIFTQNLQGRVTILRNCKMARKHNPTTFLEGTEPQVRVTSTNNYYGEQLLTCFSFLILIIFFSKNIEDTLKMDKTEAILLSSFLLLHHCCFNYIARDSDMVKENPASLSTFSIFTFC